MSLPLAAALQLLAAPLTIRAHFVDAAVVAKMAVIRHDENSLGSSADSRLAVSFFSSTKGYIQHNFILFQVIDHTVKLIVVSFRANCRFLSEVRVEERIDLFHQ